MNATCLLTEITSGSCQFRYEEDAFVVAALPTSFASVIAGYVVLTSRLRLVNTLAYGSWSLPAAPSLPLKGAPKGG